MYRTKSFDAEGLKNQLSTGHTYPSEESNSARFSAGNLAKRTFDIVAAAALILIFMPLFALISCGVIISSPGPVFYSQLRIGRAGKPFKFFKFRSMVINADAVLKQFLEGDATARDQWAKYQKLVRDPRVTNFGRFLRVSSLDELPQLWNVLLGDMSLVGPRPCMASQHSLYGPHWAAYCSVRPGITGLWQVSGRSKLTFSERVELDARYVESRSFGFDLKIMMRTIAVVLRAEGSH
jgi:lipopolysaccharide/colanic/teichoic acid biosynthesis glycosyltransferase